MNRHYLDKINIMVFCITIPQIAFCCTGTLGGTFMAETRNFALRDEKGNEIGVFTGKQPRQAALKAANRGITDIRLRERGTKKVHVFKGERVQVAKPKGAPAWMPETIWKPKVKKVGVEKLDGL
jgi:hypothetical protein